MLSDRHSCLSYRSRADGPEFRCLNIGHYPGFPLLVNERIIPVRRVRMGPLDVPEVLILLGLVACVGWAVYNWTHPHPHLPK